jgi:hypothetical protein
VIFIVAIASITLLILGIFIATEWLQKKNNNDISYHPLDKAKSGLSISDSLRNGNLTRDQLFEKFNKQYNRVWTLYGSAVVRKAPIDVYENTVEGLSLGVQSAVVDQWAGYFAMSRDDYASLFHAVITVPNKVLPVWSFSAGLYVQTSITYGNINYVACTGEASPLGVNWRVQSGTGNNVEVTHHQNLWSITSDKTSTRDCTIITNGNNYLKVYLDGKMVYTSNKLNLQMPRPFNSYLEVQTTYTAKKMLYGKFKDYYSTRDENIKVINAPVGGIVKIIETSPSPPSSSPSPPSKVLAEGTVDAHGVASLDIGKYHFPLSAQIQVYNSDKMMIASTTPNTPLYGGDVYPVTGLNPLERWMMR